MKGGWRPMRTDKRLMETRQRMTEGRLALIESDKKIAADEWRSDRGGTGGRGEEG